MTMPPSPATRGNVLLTGAGGGIGAAIARRLAAEGWTLLLVGRRPAPLAALAATLAGGADRHRCLAADITRPRDRAAVVETCAARGGIDVLINNAGVSGFALLADLDDARLAALLAANVAAPIALCRELLPQLTGRPRGHVINIGSTFGAIGHPAFSGYCASKFALRGFTEALRRELADSRVLVHYLAPRAVATDMNEPAVVRLNRALGNRVDAPEVVAAAVSQALAAKRGGDRHLGWPERFYVRLNQLLPGAIDAALRKSLAIVRQCARERATDAGRPPHSAWINRDNMESTR